MLNLCGAKWTPRFVDFFNGETRTPEYRANVNEMGEVPVLEHAGKRLTQSGVILDYLASTFQEIRLAGRTGRREILRWILWDNHKLTSYIATLRYMVTLAKVGEPPGARVPARAHQELARYPRPAPEEDAIRRRQRALASPTSRCAATCTGPTSSA